MKCKEEKIVDGFVIQVYNGNSRDRANEVWRQMDENFADLAPKISYHQPNVWYGWLENRVRDRVQTQVAVASFSITKGHVAL